MGATVIAAIAPLLAGLGLFFSGIYFISTNLAQVAGKQFRTLLTRATADPVLSALTGILAGIVLQSTNAVTCVTISLLSAGVIDKRRAMPIAIWSTVGASLLVILVAVDLRIGASYVIAAAGFSLYFGINNGGRTRHLTATLLGIGLLFLGIEMLKSGAPPLRDFIIREGIFTEASRNPIILLIFGAVLTIFCQSSTVTGAIAVTATNIALIDFNGACILIYGANLGSAANHLFRAHNLRSDERQVALMQALQKLVGFLALMGVTAVEATTGHDILQPAVKVLDNNLAGQVAWVFLLYQIVGSIVCSLWMGHLITLLERMAPPSHLEMLARPAYLSVGALVEPSLALDLAAREERRLMERLPLMLDRVRADGDANALDAETLKNAGIAISRAMSRYLEDILDVGLDRADVAKLVRLQHRTENLRLLYDSLAEFVAVAEKARTWASSGNVANQMIEAMHALLSALTDATASEDPDEQKLVLSMLGHRDELMERIRRRVLQENPDLPAAAQESLFVATMLFERIIWLARRGALLILPEGANMPSLERLDNQ
jgi:phosphate:Na+ symporter